MTWGGGQPYKPNYVSIWLENMKFDGADTILWNSLY